jgi:hypothetical protein
MTMVPWSSPCCDDRPNPQLRRPAFIGLLQRATTEEISMKVKTTIRSGRLATNHSVVKVRK